MARKQITATDLRGGSRIRSRYDAAQTTTENTNLWANVDAMSAAQANSPSVRNVIRKRARYEVANNSYAKGIVKTLANDVIGPKIQIQLGDDDIQQKAETDFMKWAKAVRLWSKLRTLRESKCVDGESFALLRTNPKIKNRVKLDVFPVECDMIEGYYTAKDDEIDGIKFDKYDNPIAYRMLTYHPGDYRGFNTGKIAGNWIDEKYMIHYFTSDRPGQVRGVSEVVSSLSLFGQLRSYTASVLEASRRAAEITGIMETDLLPDGTAAAEFDEPSVTMDFVRNQIMSLPEGWKYNGFRAEQPTNTYPDFKKEIITESGRCLSMPSNVATGNSSGYNYASGRLDHQTYDRHIVVDRSELEEMVTDRIFAEWLEEYAIKESLNPSQIESISIPQWYYCGRGHVDPAKEASADDTRIKNGTLTKTEYYAKQGKDGRREEKIRINELIQGELEWNKAREAAKLPPAPYPSGLESKQTTEPVKTIDEGENDEEK